MNSGLLNLLLAALLIAMGVFTILRPQTAARWLVFLITLRPTPVSSPSERPKLRGAFVVLIGAIYILIAVYFFLLPALSAQ